MSIYQIATLTINWEQNCYTTVFNPVNDWSIDLYIGGSIVVSAIHTIPFPTNTMSPSTNPNYCGPTSVGATSNGRLISVQSYFVSWLNDRAEVKLQAGAGETERAEVFTMTYSLVDYSGVTPTTSTMTINFVNPCPTSTIDETDVVDVATTIYKGLASYVVSLPIAYDTGSMLTTDDTRCKFCGPRNYKRIDVNGDTV
jgi:hypothetical protein